MGWAKFVNVVILRESHLSSTLLRSRDDMLPCLGSTTPAAVVVENLSSSSSSSDLGQLVGESPNVIGICAPAAPPIMLRIGTHSLNPIPKP